MRTKKDKAYVVVSVERGYIQGAFPHTKKGKEEAELYSKKLSLKDGHKNTKKYKVKVV